MSHHKACHDIQVWSTAQVEGVHRFLARSYRLVTGGSVKEAEPSNDQLRSLHIAIKRVCLSCSLNPRENLCFIRLVLTHLGPNQSNQFLRHARSPVEGLPSDAMVLKCR